VGGGGVLFVWGGGRGGASAVLSAVIVPSRPLIWRERALRRRKRRIFNRIEAMSWRDFRAVTVGRAFKYRGGGGGNRPVTANAHANRRYYS